MIWWVAGLARRAGGAIVLLLMLLCGAEVALRFADLRTSRSHSVRSTSPLESLAVPSWSAYYELRPSAALRVPTTDSSETHVVRINSFGLRGAEPQSPKPQNTFRILCLGDERLLAAELPDEDQVGSYLQRQLQPATKLEVEVWTAGTPGACPLTQFLLLTHRLTALQPDLVLSFVHADDLVQDQAYRRFTRVDRQGQPLACRHPTLGRNRMPSPLTAWRQEFRLIDKCLACAGATWKEKTSFDPSLPAASLQADIARLQHDPTAVDRTLQPLGLLADWCRDSYMSYAVVLVNDPVPVLSEDSPYLLALRALTVDRQLSFIHLASTADAHVSPTMAVWPATDHEDFAQEIARRVLAEIRGPWNSPYFQTEPHTMTPVGYETQ